MEEQVRRSTVRMSVSLPILSVPERSKLNGSVSVEGEQRRQSAPCGLRVATSRGKPGRLNSEHAGDATRQDLDSTLK
jgi:hypothetical protein